MGDLSISPPDVTDCQAQALLCLCPWYFSRMGVVFHLWLHRNLDSDFSAHHLLLRAILASTQERMESNHCPSNEVAYDGILPRSQSQNISGKIRIFKNSCLKNTSEFYPPSISAHHGTAERIKLFLHHSIMKLNGILVQLFRFEKLKFASEVGVGKNLYSFSEKDWLHVKIHLIDESLPRE